jgi:hypothetical protein
MPCPAWCSLPYFVKSKKLLGPIRGMPPAHLDQLADILVKVGQIGMELEQIKEIDINTILHILLFSCFRTFVIS